VIGRDLASYLDAVHDHSNALDAHADLLGDLLEVISGEATLKIDRAVTRSARDDAE
jgi:hypothetical protein